MTAVDTQTLPAFVTPKNLVEFAGGVANVQQKVQGLKPGTEAWRNTLVHEIRTEATANITLWLADIMESSIFLFQMQYGARPTSPGGDPEEWDGEFQDAMSRFFEPHFEYIFEADTRVQEMLEWLGRETPETPEFLESRKSRVALAGKLATEMVNSILTMKPKPGQTLSMLGIVPDATGWPAPAKVPGAENWETSRNAINIEAPGWPEGETKPKKASHLPPIPDTGKGEYVGGSVPESDFTRPVPREAKPVPLEELDAAPIKKAGKTKGKRPIQAPGISLVSSFLRELRDDGHIPGSELAEILHVSKNTITNCIAGTPPAVHCTLEAAEVLMKELRHRQERAMAISASIRGSVDFYFETVKR